MWCVAELTDQYIERMEDLLRLYALPFSIQEPVICFDEKSVQLLEDRYTPQLSQPGKLARRDHEYVRRGTANVFCAVEPKTGKYFLKVTRQRSAVDFAKVIDDLAAKYPRAKTIHLVLDNLNTHCLQSLVKHFGQRAANKLWRRFTLHFTPKHASWLNQAEIAIGIFSHAVLRRTRYPDIRELRIATSAFRKRRNHKPSPIDWRFSVHDARRKFKYAEI